MVLLALLFVVGASCDRSTFFGSKSETTEEDIFSGIQGLELSFMEGAPPNEVYQDTSFDIFVELHNQNALDVKRGTIKLSIPYLFEVSDKTKTIDTMMGKETYPGGETEIIEWTGVKVKGTTVRKDTRQTANVQVCYAGDLEAQPMVCVRPRPGSDGIIEGECNIGKKSLSGGQGAPIAVTSVTETVLKESDNTNTMVFRFEVEDVGGGKVIDVGEVNDCSISAKDKTKAEIIIEKVTWLGSETGFECEGGKEEKDKVIMLNGKGVFKCTSPAISNDEHYSLPLYIKMNYGYVKSINKGFTLKKDIFYAD